MSARSWKPLDSISAYYYSSGAVAFSGVLAALAVYLLTYRGYRNQHGAQDRLTGWTAGVAAIVVATFPTPPDSRLGWYAGWIGVVHYAAATVLFTCFAVFSLFLFTRSAPGVSSRGKQGRNLVYRICGFAIVICLLWIAIFHAHPIFLPETLALVFFAASWLIKGRVDHTVVALGTRAARYRRDPRKLIADVSGNVRRLSGKPN